MEQLLSPGFLQIFLPLVSGVAGWMLNEHRKRSDEEYRRKEERYVELISAINGFYVETSNSALKQEFLRQLNLCWLYCPDEVILRGYAFIETVRSGKISSDEEKEASLGNFVSTVRRDLLSRKLTGKTRLTGKDFRNLRAT